LIHEFHLALDPDEQQYASLKVACEMTMRARSMKRHILFFVHGYNNDMTDVLNAAFRLEERYEVELLPFSWPARGGGIAGKLSYLADKLDARASTGALERTLQKMYDYLMLITEARRTELHAKAWAKHSDNAALREALYAELLEKECPFTVNALFHSMGNYLLKHMLKSSANQGNMPIFDNVVLCQADTNNENHEEWVDQIQHNSRVFVTINENDFALKASRMKPGSAQRARLGHYTRRLTSRIAHYINLTNAPWVRNSHSPFDEPADRNDRVLDLFRNAFTGRPAEATLSYQPEGNWYEVRR
jgi:esterase/lipase superfamily enzyme